MLFFSLNWSWSSLVCDSTKASSTHHFPDEPIFRKPQVTGPDGSASNGPNSSAETGLPLNSTAPVFPSFKCRPIVSANCLITCHAPTVAALSPQNHISSCSRYRFDSVVLLTAKSRQNNTASSKASPVQYFRSQRFHNQVSTEQ